MQNIILSIWAIISLFINLAYSNVINDYYADEYENDFESWTSFSLQCTRTLVRQRERPSVWLSAILIEKET